jgi:hypothetical protein
MEKVNPGRPAGTGSGFDPHNYIFKKKKGRCQWLMPVILATWEAESRRITCQG